MSSLEMAANGYETRVHYERRRDISRLEAKVRRTKWLYYDQGSLDELKIRTYPLTLTELGDPSFLPCFFMPYTGELCEEPYYDDMDMEWNPYHTTEGPAVRAQRWASRTCSYWRQYAQSQNIDPRLPDKNKYGFGDIPFFPEYQADCFGLRPLGEYDSADSAAEWYGLATGPIQKDLPHLISIVISSLDGDNERLNRGEVLAIIRLLQGRLHVRHLAQSLITPILLFSFMGPRHARMLQAYYDGDELIIHKTEPFDFTNKKDTAALLIFTRWAGASAMGDTTSEEKPEVKYEKSRVGAKYEPSLLAKRRVNATECAGEEFSSPGSDF